MQLQILNRTLGMDSTAGARSILALLAVLISWAVAAQPVSDLVINEVMALNGSTLADEDGDFEDWIELFNRGTEPINLEGYGLSDSYGKPFKWVFPDITIMPEGYLLVWASGKNRTDPEAPLHAGYSLSASGEEVILTHPDGTRLDEFQPLPLNTDISFGRVPDGGAQWFYFEEATPGTSNTTTPYTSVLSPVSFSHTGGFFTESFDLQLTAPVEDATIIYTLDGSRPDINNLDGTTYLYKNSYPQNPSDPFGPFLEQSYTSLEYRSPINIYDRSGEPDKLTQMSSTWDRNPRYFPSTPVKKGTVVRAKAFKKGAIPSKTTSNTYFVWERGNPYQLPIISITTQETHLFDYYDGIYNAGFAADDWRKENPYALISWLVGNFQTDKEYPAHFEYFNFNDHSQSLKQNIGWRIHGGGGRIRPNKSMRLYARSQYDEKNIFDNDFFNDDFSINANMQSEVFKRLLIRNGGNLQNYLTDYCAHKIMEPVFDGVQRGRNVIHFINGEFWGIIQLKDRQDQYHLAYNFDLDPDNIVILNGIWGQGEASHIDVGEPEDLLLYRDMYNYIINNDMSDDQVFEPVKSMIDLISYIDYNVMMIYFSNRDWYGNKHFKFWRVREPSDTDGYDDGKWRFMVWDFDDVASLKDVNANHLLSATHPEGGGTFYSPKKHPYYFKHADKTALMRNLLENNRFTNLFINRFADHINTTFCPQQTANTINDSYDEINLHNAEHNHRWASLATTASSRNNFISYMNQRPSIQRQQIREIFGIGEDINLTIDVSHPSQGHIRINTVEIVPTTPGVSDPSYPWTGIYFAGVPLGLEAIPSPGYIFVGWEGLPEATSAVVEHTPMHNLSIKALFAPGPELIHYWHFNDQLLIAGEVPSDFSAVGEAQITYSGTGAGYMDFRTHRTADPVSNHNLDMGQQPDQGAVLRVRNPSDTRELVFAAPTTGFAGIEVNYATTRTSNGATMQQLFYSPDSGANWTAIGQPYEVPEFDPAAPNRGYEYVHHNLTDFSDIDNNDILVFKIVFLGEEAVNNSGNNRFDNFSIRGKRLTQTATIFAIAGIGGTITPTGTVKIDSGSDQEFIITPDDGFAISDVLVDGVSMGAVETFTLSSVNTNHTITVSFRNTTSITETDNFSIRVFPNPTKDRITIKSTIVISEVHLIDLFGKRQKTKSVNDLSVQFDVSMFPPGVYFIQIMTNEGLRVVRINVVR